MAIKTVFIDTENNEMDCYLNDNGKLYISVGQPEGDGYYSGWITLDKEDAKSLIKILTKLESEMIE
jgi:hypothetical protein